MLQRLFGMALDCVEVVQGIGSAEPARVDQAHEYIPQPSPVLSFVAQRVFSMEDGHFEGPLTEVVIQGRTATPQPGLKEGN